MVDTYVVLYDIYTDTRICFEKRVCDYADTCGTVAGGIICGGLGIWRHDEISWKEDIILPCNIAEKRV